MDNLEELLILFKSEITDLTEEIDPNDEEDWMSMTTG